MDFIQEPERIYLPGPDGTAIAEVTFRFQPDGSAVINHTFVDPSLRGQGAAGKLLQAAADRFRAEGRKVIPTCSYAMTWFEQHRGERDLLGRPCTR